MAGELSERERLEIMELLLRGAEYEVEAVAPKSGKGRPKRYYKIGKYRLDQAQKNMMDNIEPVEVSRDLQHVQEVVGGEPVMNEEDLQRFCRVAVPKLFERAIRMALSTDDAKFVLMVAKEAMDRGYGKPTQSVAVVDPNKDIRAGWVFNVEDVQDAEIIDR